MGQGRADNSKAEPVNADPGQNRPIIGQGRTGTSGQARAMTMILAGQCMDTGARWGWSVLIETITWGIERWRSQGRSITGQWTVMANIESGMSKERSSF